MVDWGKDVLTKNGEKVVKLDDNFKSAFGPATLFKVLPTVHLSSPYLEKIYYQSHETGKCYNLYRHKTTNLTLENKKTKHKKYGVVWLENDSAVLYNTLFDDVADIYNELSDAEIVKIFEVEYEV